jgi:hypothetical protein
MEHTAECLHRTQLFTEAIAEYQARWPNYCRKCNGWGSKTVYDSIEAWGANCSMPSEEPCPDCLEKDLCPRCGVLMGLDWENITYAACPHCGWSEEEADGCPELDVDDCSCGEEVWNEAWYANPNAIPEYDTSEWEREQEGLAEDWLRMVGDDSEME